MVRDEVCGMKFPTTKAAVRTTIEGRVYYSCSKDCRDRFISHPDWYVPVEP